MRHDCGAASQPRSVCQSRSAILDIQCLTYETFRLRRGELSRCQLSAGHEGAHALMFCRDGLRIVRTWPGAPSESFDERTAGQENLPWSVGMPVPMWAESTTDEHADLLSGAAVPDRWRGADAR